MNIIIDGIECSVAAESTILDAAASIGIHIPTLCYLKDINKIASCRICVVQVNNSSKLLPACLTRVAEGMIVETNNSAVRNARKTALELLCADHRMECSECSSGAYCTLRDLCHEYEVDDKAFGKGSRLKITDESTTYLIRDNSKCLLCRRCLSTCAVVQGTGAIAINNKGAEVNIGFTHGIELKDTRCIGCGQCVKACPTGALSVRDDTKKVWKALYDKSKYVVIGLSTDTCYSLGKMFGEKEEINNSGKIVAILKAIGFDAVIDSGCMDDKYRNETLEMVTSLPKQEDRTYLSSNCLGWLNYIKLHKPELMGHVINMPPKSGYVAKECKRILDDKDVFYVDISNCLAAKTTPIQYVDAHITTKELFSLIRRACVSNYTANQVWDEIELAEFDKLRNHEYKAKSMEVTNNEIRIENISNYQLKVISVSGMRNAMNMIKTINDVDFMEIYACPGGCKNGGGA